MLRILDSRYVPEFKTQPVSEEVIVAILDLEILSALNGPTLGLDLHMEELYTK